MWDIDKELGLKYFILWILFMVRNNIEGWLGIVYRVFMVVRLFYIRLLWELYFIGNLFRFVECIGIKSGFYCELWI